MVARKLSFWDISIWIKIKFWIVSIHHVRFGHVPPSDFQLKLTIVVFKKCWRTITSKQWVCVWEPEDGRDWSKYHTLKMCFKICHLFRAELFEWKTSLVMIEFDLSRSCSSKLPSNKPQMQSVFFYHRASQFNFSTRQEHALIYVRFYLSLPQDLELILDGEFKYRNGVSVSKSEILLVC